MAKCVVCNSRKGKRKCAINDAVICPGCCGEIRDPGVCADCSFYKPPENNYQSVPFYSVRQMADSNVLTDAAYEVEFLFCRLDSKSGNVLGDKDMLRLIELIFDKYYFKDTVPDNLDAGDQYRLDTMSERFGKALGEPSDVDLMKIMGAIYRSIQRRTLGRREYLEFIQGHMGD